MPQIRHTVEFSHEELVTLIQTTAKESLSKEYSGSSKVEFRVNELKDGDVKVNSIVVFQGNGK